MGEERSDPQLPPMPEDIDRLYASSGRCLDKDAEQRMISAIKAAAKEGDSLGGGSEILPHGVPVGSLLHVHWDHELDALLPQAICSIHAVKAVENGDAVSNVSLRGSQATMQGNLKMLVFLSGDPQDRQSLQLSPASQSLQCFPATQEVPVATKSPQTRLPPPSHPATQEDAGDTK